MLCLAGVFGLPAKDAAKALKPIAKADPAPASTYAAYASGHCTQSHLYGSSAWELTGYDASVGADNTCSSEKYMGWVGGPRGAEVP